MADRTSGYGVGAARIPLAPVPNKLAGVPANTNTTFGQDTFDTVSGTWYKFAGTTAGWIAQGGGSTEVSTINSLSPVAGNIVIAGTASQITMTSAGNTITASIPSAFIAPGSIAATTTLTATLGNVTATNGNFVASTAGTGLLFAPATTSGTTTATLNGRVGQVTITTPSISAGATAVMTISNTSITGSSTQVMYTLTGGTTGAALTIQSYANTANQSVVTIQNGTGATTNTASLILNFLVLN